MRARPIVAVLALLLAAAFGLSDDAIAKKKKKKPKKKPDPVAQKAPQADKRAVSELMGDFKWGMTVEETLEVVYKKIDERYAEKIKATTDVYVQNKLRKKAAGDKKKVRDTYIEFKGQETSWDVSIVDREFGHKDDEAMFVVWESDIQTGRDQRRFYFFLDGKLWKMFIAFNTEQFEGMTFQDFKKVMEDRYGKSAEKMRGNPDGTEEVDYLFWRAGNVYLRAIDLTKVYSAFCLALSDEDVEKTIYARREERNPSKKGPDNITDSVTDQGGSDQKPPEENRDVVDRITGGGGG